MKSPTSICAGNFAVSVLASALDWRKKPKPLPQHYNNSKTIIPCINIMQEYEYSTAASCLQMLMRSKGIKLSHATAMARLGIEDTCASPRQIQRAISRYYNRWSLKKIQFPEREIDKGNLVMAVALNEEPQDHLVIIKGYNKNDFWVVDPKYRGSCIIKKSQIHFQALGQYYALSKKNINL